MSAANRAKKAQALINEVTKMTPPGPFSYHDSIAEVRRIVIDTLTLIRDDALEEDALASKSTPES